MRIKHAPEGSEIVCCGATAEIISHGPMGTRLKVLTIPENSGFVLGFQIWSAESVVELITEYAQGGAGIGKSAINSHIATKLPLTLFGGLK